MGAATESLDNITERIEKRALGIKEVIANRVSDPHLFFRKLGVEIPVEEEEELRKSIESRINEASA